jgi:hypothetical protein
LRKGFGLTDSRYMCWINAGDLLLPGALDAASAALEESGADLIFGDDFYIDDNGAVLKLSRGYVPNLRDAMLYGAWTPLQDACFWRRELYDRVGGIDSTLRFAADYDLFLRMALKGKCVYVPHVFSAFRRHPGQKSISGSQQYKKERQRVRKREIDAIPGSSAGKALLSAWHKTRIRWRYHVMERTWRREDLVGRPVQQLRSAVYWPATPPR